jgi:multidrug efflux pump subunit AcrB
VSIKLIADSTDKLPELKRVAKEFENFVKSIEGVKNVTNTSADSPGEIIFRVDRARAASVGVSPLQIYGEISGSKQNHREVS